MGKLYINYPMMQAYKHFKALPDPEFMNRDASPAGYKERVHSESRISDLARYTYRTFATIALYNLSKVWKILGNTEMLPKADEYKRIDWTAIFDIETDKYKSTQRVDVLHTLIFFLIDYNPTSFFRETERHPESFDFM